METKRRKKRWCGVGALAVCFILTGCCMSHEWSEATCTEPKTCTKCGKTEGEVLEHTWVDATCTEPKHCSVCGETEGEPLEHIWVDATCAEAKHCSVCGETEGEPLVHTLTKANYQQAATCEVCGETVGEPLQADFEKYELTCNAEPDVTQEYIAECGTNQNYTTTGTITFSDYDTFTSDDAHDALDGYEWKAVTLTMTFGDDNAQKYGMKFPSLRYTDYYNIPLLHDNFAVNYNGIEYELLADAETIQDGWDDNGVDTWQIRIYVRVPAAYDGIVIYTTNISNADIPEGSYDNEIINESSVLFRLK